MKTIELQCPQCRRKKRVKRQPYDPKDADRLSLLCDKCDHGGGFSAAERLAGDFRSGVPDGGRTTTHSINPKT